VELATAIGLTRSTTHRLAATLIERRYLALLAAPATRWAEIAGTWLCDGAANGPSRIAREHLEALSASTGDTVHLGILDGSTALYLDKIQGTRRVEIGSRIGERQPFAPRIGKALILDADDAQLRECYDQELDWVRLYRPLEVC